MLRAPFRLLVLVALLAAGLVVSGCDISDFGDLNDDPTSPNQIDADLLISRALAYGTLRYTTYQRAQHLFGNMYAQYFANLNPDFTTTDRYQSDPPYNAWATSLWRTTYASRGGVTNIGENVENSGINIQIAINQTRDDPQKINITSQAKIWKVYLLHRVTDAWGSVPYFEAFKGLEGNRTPAYDPQEKIYRAMLDMLDAAAERLDPSIQGDRFRLGSADILYGNYDEPLKKWRRFANSLRLRLAMRVSEAAPELARQHATDALSGGVMQGNDDSARRPTTPGGQFITQNPLSIIATFNDDRVSERVVDTLKALDDPRLPVYADTIAGAFADTVLYRGLPNGLSPAALSGVQSFKYSRLGDPVRRQDFPVPVLLYSEVQFLQAEAALRGWANNPGAHYEEGIRASLEMYGVPDSTIQAYLQQPEVAWAPGASPAAKLEQIIAQKWIALFTQGLEAWAEYRRTGYPDLISIPTDGQTGGAVPSRILYPNVERTTNTQNVREAADQIGGDDMTTDVWWDQERSDLVRSDGSE